MTKTAPESRPAEPEQLTRQRMRGRVIVGVERVFERGGVSQIMQFRVDLVPLRFRPRQVDGEPGDRHERQVLGLVLCEPLAAVGRSVPLGTDVEAARRHLVDQADDVERVVGTLGGRFEDMGKDRGDAGIPDVRDTGLLLQLAEDRVVGVLPSLDPAARHRPEPLVQQAGSHASQEQPA